MNYKKNNGFVLVETILAITLVSSIAGFSLMQAKLKNETLETQALGRTLSDLIAGFDKKVTLEGHVKNNVTEEWSGVWLNSHDVYQDLILDELIAYQNPQCGKPDGWEPYYAEDSELALVSCNIFNPRKLPFGFEMEADADSTIELDGSVEGRALKGWTIRLYHPSYTHWERYGHIYNDVIKAARTYDVARVSGRHNYRLVHRGTNRELTSKECFLAQDFCAIEASFMVSDNGINVDSGLRADGKNSMRSNLSFSVDIDADKVACYTPSKLIAGEFDESECGLEYKEKTHTLNLLTDDTSSVYANLMPQFEAESVSAMGAAPAIPVQVLCNGQRCGFSYFDRDGSAAASAYLNQTVADEVVFRRTIKEINETLATTNFEVDEKGEMSAWNAVIKADGAPTDRVITLVTDSGDSFTVTNEGSVDTLRNLHVLGDVVSDEIITDGNLVTNGAYVGKYQSVGSQSVCDNGNRGVISSRGGTGLYTCTSTGWVKINEPIYDSGLIYGTESGVCDDGFSPFTQANGRKLAHSGYSTSTTLLGGVKTVYIGVGTGADGATLTKENLPPHRHNFADRYSRGSEKAKGGSSSADWIKSYDKTTSNTGGGNSIYHDTRDPSYGVAYCIKD